MGFSQEYKTSFNDFADVIEMIRNGGGSDLCSVEFINRFKELPAYARHAIFQMLADDGDIEVFTNLGFAFQQWGWTNNKDLFEGIEDSFLFRNMLTDALKLKNE